MSLYQLWHCEILQASDTDIKFY